MPLTPEERRARRRVYMREYQRKRDKSKLRDKGRLYYQKNRERLLAKYKDEYHVTKESERRRPNCCDVCGATNRPIVWDHCHQRQVFRGWLCTNCNVVLGHVRDDPNHLRKLIAYLERTAKLVPLQLALSGL